MDVEELKYLLSLMRRQATKDYLTKHIKAKESEHDRE